MFCVVFLLCVIAPSDTTVTIPTPQLFTNTLQRWGVEIRDKGDLGQRWARFREAVELVHQTTSGILLTSLNRFTVMNDAEYKELAAPLFHNSLINMTQQVPETRAPYRASVRKKRSRSLPDTYSYWEDVVGLNPPRNQFGCGSCWSFPTVGALEAVTKQLTGDDVSYTEQYFVDCAFDYDGCSGGDANDGFKLTEERQYLMSPTKLPYTGLYTKCQYTDDIKSFTDNAMDKIWLQNWYPITRTEPAFFEALTYSPIAYGAQVSSALSAYSGGVFEDTGCKANPKPHAMMIVGYNEDTIRVKASYGKDWGDAGYVNYKRGSPHLTSCKFFDRGFFIQATYRRELQYAYCNEQKTSTYKECSASCSSLNQVGQHGWTLAVVPTKYHNEVARELLRSDYPEVKSKEAFTYFWIGLTELSDQDGSYGWEDDFTPLKYAPFSETPSNKWGLMNKDTGKWITKSSTTFKARGLCSRPETCRDIGSSIRGGSVVYSADPPLPIAEGVTAYVSCDDGLKLTGADTLTCVGGRWDVDLPTCTAWDGSCTYEADPRSSHTPDKTTFSAGEQLQITCLQEGTTTQHTCNSGTFTPTITPCKEGLVCVMGPDSRITRVPEGVTALLQDDTVTVTCVKDESVTATLTCDKGVLKPSFNVDERCGSGGGKLTVSFIAGGFYLFVVFSGLSL